MRRRRNIINIKLNDIENERLRAEADRRDLPLAVLIRIHLAPIIGNNWITAWQDSQRASNSLGTLDAVANEIGKYKAP